MFNLFKKYYIKNFEIGNFSEGTHGCMNSYVYTYTTVSYEGIYKGKSYFYNYVLHSHTDGSYFWSKIKEDNISKEFAYKFAIDIKQGKYKSIIKRILRDDFKKKMIEMEYKRI